jgi:hypothetical protein
VSDEGGWRLHEGNRRAHRGMEVLLAVLKKDAERNPDCHVGILFPELEAAARRYAQIVPGAYKEVTT